MTTAVRKGPEAFRTISEASSELGVPQHVLRFWETKFAFVRPTKRAGGRRFYRPQDLQVLRGVRTLLQEEGYTIKGVQKLHREGGMRRLAAAAGLEGAAAAALVSEPPAGPGLEGEPAADGDTAEAWSAPPPRQALDAGAHRRLSQVLRDLEGAKAEIDALLGEGAD